MLNIHNQLLHTYNFMLGLRPGPAWFVANVKTRLNMHVDIYHAQIENETMYKSWYVGYGALRA